MIECVGSCGPVHSGAECLALGRKPGHTPSNDAEPHPTLPHLSPAVFAVLVSIILIYGVSHTLRRWRSHARMAAAVERVRLSLEAKRAAEADIPRPAAQAGGVHCATRRPGGVRPGGQSGCCCC